MNIHEFYQKIEGNYQDTKDMIGDDDAIVAFAKRFPKISKMDQVRAALESGDAAGLFKLTHGLKGAAGSIGFTRLATKVAVVCDSVRCPAGGTQPPCPAADSEPVLAMFAEYDSLLQDLANLES